MLRCIIAFCFDCYSDAGFTTVVRLRSGKSPAGGRKNEHSWYGLDGTQQISHRIPLSTALFKKIPHWESFWRAALFRGNHICPITAWPVAAVGAEAEWVMCYPFKSNFSHANSWHVWLYGALGWNCVFETKTQSRPELCDNPPPHLLHPWPMEGLNLWGASVISDRKLNKGGNAHLL